MSAAKEVPAINPEWLVGITMTSEQKAKWLAALRSGEYGQCKKFLHFGGAFCCLGVAAKVVFGVEPKDMGVKKSLLTIAKHFVAHDGDACGLEEELATMNDHGWSFAEIADFIEANIPACDEVRS